MADERKGRTQDESGVGQNTRLPAGRCGGGRAGLSRGVSLCARDEGALRRRGDNGVQPAPGHRRHLRRHADEPFYRERPALRRDARGPRREGAERPGHGFCGLPGLVPQPDLCAPPAGRTLGRVACQLAAGRAGALQPPRAGQYLYVSPGGHGPGQHAPPDKRKQGLRRGHASRPGGPVVRGRGRGGPGRGGVRRADSRPRAGLAAGGAAGAHGLHALARGREPAPGAGSGPGGHARLLPGGKGAAALPHANGALRGLRRPRRPAAEDDTPARRGLGRGRGPGHRCLLRAEVPLGYRGRAHSRREPRRRQRLHRRRGGQHTRRKPWRLGHTR